MDEPVEPKQDGLRNLTKARVMGKLFGKEKKPVGSTDEEVSAFLHGPSDKLYMATSPGPPKLPKLDVSNARRWPTAAVVNRSRDPSRRRSASPKRSKKGLIVRFTETQPEIIGEGGDEAESPTLEISKRKRAYSHPPIIQRVTESNERSSDGPATRSDTQRFRPVPTQWSQTTHEVAPQDWAGPRPKELSARHSSGSDPAPSTNLVDTRPPYPDDTPSRMQAEMRAAEGRAFRLASQSLVPADNTSANGPLNEKKLTPSPLPIHIRTPPIPQGQTQFTSETRPAQTIEMGRPLDNAGMQASAVSSGVDVLDDFYSRLQHLYKLFRLSAESVLPLSASPFDSLVRAASWWLLRGRSAIENAIRVRPSSREGQQSYGTLQQQGHADVAKAVWILRDILSQRPEMSNCALDDLTQQITASRNSGHEYHADLLERCQSIMSNLKMLCMSMQRNNCLPPSAEDAPLPQGLDTSIWIKYPSPPTDIMALLSNGNEGLIDRSLSYKMTISEAIPLGDTKKSFEYARMFVDVIVMERGTESLQYHWPSIMFISRAQTDQYLSITISSQNGQVALAVKSDKKIGLTWNDVNWQSKISAIDINLSRRFIARVQCSPDDFKTLWNMSDYTEKVYAILRSRKYEEVVFEAILKTFQYFDRDPQSRNFPKEPIAGCRVKILEKRLTNDAGNDVGRKHRGFRIAVVTSSKTKNLFGISHDISPSKPMQYSLMRGDEGKPALLLKFDDATRRPTMVLTFENVSERSQLFSHITGGPRIDEIVVARVAVKDFSVAQTSVSVSKSSNSQNALSNFEWHAIQVVNKKLLDGRDADSSQVVLSDSLRIIVDAKAGSITDPIYVEPGEMKIRINPQLSFNELTILRQPQDDLSVSISESQTSKEMPGELTTVLEKISKSQTIRKYSFHDIAALHEFQGAVTGHHVHFDGLAESFSMSRRRTVVSIHKKWETLHTRLQVLQHEQVMQIAAFFTDISHGECMNFIIKATDVFESFNRSGKFHVRLVDAKFALPKVGDESPDSYGNGFVCLDTPDFPGEHDDITISFDSEAVRDEFVKALPAPAKIVSKLGTIRR